MVLLRFNGVFQFENKSIWKWNVLGLKFSIFFDEACYFTLSAVFQGFLHHYAGSAEYNSGVFARFRAKYRTSSCEDNLGCRTVDLCTSTIKMGAEDTDLRLCFRIISPLKTYTLQVILTDHWNFFSSLLLNLSIRSKYSKVSISYIHVIWQGITSSFLLLLLLLNFCLWLYVYY